MIPLDEITCLLQGYYDQIVEFVDTLFVFSICIQKAIARKEAGTSVNSGEGEMKTHKTSQSTSPYVE